MVSQSAKVLLQVVYFLLVARKLGVSAFGEFVASLALVSVLSPFAALGTGNLLVMHVSRHPSEFPRRWGNALAAIPSAGVVLSLLAVGVAACLPALDVVVVAALCLSEIFLNRLADTAAQAFQAFSRFVGASLVWMLVPALRAAASVAFAIGGFGGVREWVVFYVAASGVAATAALIIACSVLGRPSRASWHGLTSLRDGAYFSVAQSASSIYADIDKTMLAQLASTHAAGIYAAAYRVINVGFVPVISLFQATYARFFKRGEEGVAATRAFARTLLPYLVAYGVLVGVVMYFSAPLVPKVLGPDYGSAAAALRWLAAVPLLQAMCYLGGDTLTGAGKQGLRTTLHVLAAFSNVALNLVLIPLYSWRGAAWATLATFALLAVSLRFAVVTVAQRTPQASASPAVG